MTTDHKKFAAGENILSKGQKAECAYLIKSGSVRVFLEKDDKILDLATLGPGQIFGETALLEHASYGANVSAIEDTELTVITPASLEQKIQDCDPIIQSIIRMLIERQHKTNEALLKSETREHMDIAFI